MMHDLMENEYTASAEDTFTFHGDAGATRMYNLLRLLCHDVPADLGGMRVLFLRDHEHGVELDVCNMRTRPFPCERETVVELELAGGGIRLAPAGEPSALRVTLTSRAASPAAADARLERMRSALHTWFGQRSV